MHSPKIEAQIKERIALLERARLERELQRRTPQEFKPRHSAEEVLRFLKSFKDISRQVVPLTKQARFYLSDDAILVSSWGERLKLMQRYYSKTSKHVQVYFDGRHRRLDVMVLNAFRPEAKPRGSCNVWHLDGDLENCHLNNLDWE